MSLNQQEIKLFPRSIFRAYDIRGIVSETLTPENIYQIALAAGSEARERGIHKIFVGRDGRISSPHLIKSLCSGLLDTGLDVVDIGIVPTPVLYYATQVSTIQSGIMLTGSHNPAEYNGLKFVFKKSALTQEDIESFYQRIIEQRFISGSGTLKKQDILPNYFETITKQISLSRPLKVVIDCGNGVAGIIAPQLIKALGCDVIELYSEVDGNFPNHHPDPSDPQNLLDLQKQVQIHQADVGIAFDGDADRLGIITNTGEIICPDRQMMLFAHHILLKNPHAKIVFDVKCTGALAEVVKAYGGQPMMWKTGHSFIKNKMAEESALFGGEMSGHLFFKDRWFGVDDAIYAAVRLLEILSQSHRTINDIFADYPQRVSTNELKLSVAEENKFQLMKQFIAAAQFDAGEISTMDGIRVDFPEGWGLMRPSNTTPYLIFRFEAVDVMNLKKIQEMFRRELSLLDAGLKLPF